MPPNRAANGLLSRGVTATDDKLQDVLTEVARGTLDLASTLGQEADSALSADTHKRLAAQVQKLGATDATLSIKRQATFSALKSMAADIDRRAARGPGGAGSNEPPAHEMDMAYFLDEMKSKVSSAMQGADQKALGSQAYKDVLKQIIPPNDDDSDGDIVVPPAANKVSLKCPCTSTTFVNPVKNKPCGHTYSESAIHNHIRVGGKNGAAANCPVAGCSHKVLKSNLVEDKEMKRRLRIDGNTQSTQPEQDAEEIDDEPIEMGETVI